MKLIKSSARFSGSTRKLLGLGCALACALAAHSFAAPGDLYVSDLATNSIVVYHPDGSAFTFATGLDQPQGLVFDQEKNLYVADKGSGNIYKYSLNGTRTIFASGLVEPIGLAFDPPNILVAENGADRVSSVNVRDPSQRAIIKLLSAPVDASTSAQNRYVTNTASVFKLDLQGTQTDIWKASDHGSRGVGVRTEVGGSAPAITIFVTSDGGAIYQIALGEEPVLYASGHGLVTPTGVAFRPKRFNGDMDRVNDLYAADPGAGKIFQYASNGNQLTFVEGGQPNFLAFEVKDLPTPTPTATPSATPVPSGTPTPTPTPDPTPTPQPTPTPAPKPLNISTRVSVMTGDNVAIGGFIITGGSTAKTVAIRAIGPSLANSNPPIDNPLLNPTLELHGSDGAVIGSNDDWKQNSDADKTAIIRANLAPGDNRESVILATLAPLDPAMAGSGAYTAVVKGKAGGSGIALVEIFDLDDPSSVAQLANISTRGFVGTGENVLIGGLIIGPTQSDFTDAAVAVRALGPSLADAVSPVADVLNDPSIEIFNGNGDSLIQNDNWQDTPANEAAVTAAGLAPSRPEESAVVANLLPGNYTAIVRGVDDTTGVALVEVYHLDDAASPAK